MGYRVMVHPDARKVLDGLSEDRRRKVLEGLRQLEENPHTPRPKMDLRKIKGTAGRRDVYRLRVGGLAREPRIGAALTNRPS